MGRPKVWIRNRKAGKGRRLRPIIVAWEKLPEIPREQKSFKRDREAAEEFAAQKRLELRTAGPLTTIDRNITVEAYGTLWLDELEKTRKSGRGLKFATIRSYRIQCEQHIFPALGAYRLRDLHQQHVEAFLNERLASDAARGTVHTIYAVLRRLVQRAKHQGVIQTNCVVGVWRELPAELAPNESAEKKRKALAFDELGAFLKATGGGVNHVHGSLWYVVAKTGMRFGEALGLRVGDVDLVAGDLTIRRSLDPELKGRTVEDRTGSTKTKRSRTFEMGADLVAFLAEYLDWRGGAGDVWLFPGNEGLPLNRDTASWTFEQIATAAGLKKKYTPHSLRHTYASQMLMRGAPLLWVAKQLGHSPEMCLRTYAWALPAGDRQWANLLDSAAGGVATATAPIQGPTHSENSEPLVTISDEERASLKGESVETSTKDNKGPSSFHSTCGNDPSPEPGDLGCEPEDQSKS